jgi:ABC-type sugar transport system substrate-binding protein
MAAILQSGEQIDGVYVYLAGGIGVVNAFTQAGEKYVPVATGAGYNNEPCTMKKLQPAGLQMISVAGQQAIYAKALEQTVRILDGEDVEKKQFFDPRELSTDDMDAVGAACQTDKPDLFGINYEFPGLDLPLADTLRYYEGEQ